ncbi:MAG: DUF58 domain-containing protein [Chloroflexota bacterium]|nr:MAG: DUF58 domain-containing protein [Chloroflexota bacterium]
MTELFILILLLIAVAFIARVDFIFYIAYVLIGVFASSRWLVPRMVRSLQAGRRSQSHAFLGEPVKVTVTLDNTGRLPLLWLQLVESVPPALRSGPAINHVVHLAPKKQRRLRYHVRAMKRGYYRLGPLQITAGDLFGFQESQVTLEPTYLTVYPRIIPITKLNLPSRLPFGTLRSKQRIFEDPARPHGIRDYRLGDSIRLVNWKVTAHSNTLLVKTHEPAISLESVILLDLNVDDYTKRYRHDGPEQAIVVAASLASHLIAKRQSVGLISNGADPLLQRQFTPEGQDNTPDWEDNAPNGEDSVPDWDPDFDSASGRLTLSDAQLDDAKNDQVLSPAANLVPDPILPKSGRGHLMQILERLARLEGARTLPFANYAYRLSLNLGWGVTLLAIVPDVKPGFFDAMHRLVKAGFNLVLLIVEPYADFPSVRERARLLGIPAYHVADRNALKRWQQVDQYGR